MKAFIALSLLLLALAGSEARKHGKHSGGKHRQLHADENLPEGAQIKDFKHLKGDWDHEEGPHGPPHGKNGSHHEHKEGHHGPHGPHHEPFSPHYEVLNKTFEFETRQYNSSSWVATNASGWAWEFALPKAVQKLMGYAHGGNQKDKHFPPGVPILSKYLPSEDFSNCEKRFMVAAYLPKRPGCNATLPAPIDPTVVVKTFPGAKVYVRTFPGFSFHWNFLAEAFRLAKALKHDNVAIQEGMFFAAVYNPPTRLFGRRNEVWFLPSEEDAAAAGFLWASEGTAAISSVQLEQLTTAAAQAA